MLLCYFVGNDFLPHLPALDIRTGGLDALLRIYKRLLPAWRGYLTCDGDIDFPRLGAVLADLGAIESVMFRKRAEAAARGNLRATNGHFEELHERAGAAAPGGRLAAAEAMLDEAEFEAHAARHGVGWGGAEEESDSQAELGAGAGGASADGAAAEEWRAAYYRDKHRLGLGAEAEEGHHALRTAFVQGVAWCYAYYYRGYSPRPPRLLPRADAAGLRGRGRGRCASWEWFFPYHYAPLASDLAETCAALASGAPAFEPGVPFEPFQQLLAVLPPASAGLLPRPVAALMRDPRITEFYPSDFQCGPSLPCALRVPVP